MCDLLKVYKIMDILAGMFVYICRYVACCHMVSPYGVQGE